jgi:hypothetical protein
VTSRPATLVYPVVEDERSVNLRRLHSMPSGALVATGAWIAVCSFDEGMSWHEFGGNWLHGESIVEIIEHDGCAIAFTKGEQNRIRIWRGGLEPDQWTRTSNSWDAWLVYAGVAFGDTLVAGVYDGDTLEIFFSSDVGVTWKRNLRVPTSGTLHNFVVNASGVAVAMFGDGTEMFDGSDFQCTVMAMDVMSGRVVDRRTFRANVQSAFSSGQYEWLLGANSGLLFSYNSRTYELKTRAVLEDAALNITGIHIDQDKLALIAEESDPPGKVWLVYEDDVGQWSRFPTGIECYVSGTSSVRNGIVILADAIYRLDFATQ